MSIPTLQTIKSALKVDFTYDDAELLRLRDAVMSFITSYTGVNLSVQNKTQYITWFMRTRLDEQPFAAITSVQYYNTANVLTTMASTEYFLDRSGPPSVYINFSNFPSIYENTQILVNYTAGYADLPMDMQQAIIGFVGAWYNNPDALSPIQLQEVPISAKFVLDTLKVKGALE